MHELAITQHMVDLAVRHADGAGARRITDVHVVVGTLSGASAECIRFYWDIIAERTPAHGARLHFREIAFELECLGCGVVFRPDGRTYSCPACRGTGVRVVRGHELYVESIDVEQRPERAALPMEATP